MWYLVNLPGNKLNVAVKTEKNSIAADCLNKVSCKLITFLLLKRNSAPSNIHGKLLLRCRVIIIDIHLDRQRALNEIIRSMN